MTASEPQAALPYSPRPDRRDEMLDPSGGLRPGWASLHARLSELGPGGLTGTAARIQRRLRSHGTTFQIHAGEDEPWTLDPIPLAVPGLDWSGLGLALTQRALVIEAVLADLAGERRLLRQGLLPADALVAHDGLLLATLDNPPPAGRHLLTCAADVVRGPDGTYTVLADHVDDPADAGYVLEDRAVLADVVPDLVRSLGVRRIAPWFEGFRRMLVGAAPVGVDDPRVVVLTAGPSSPSAFEEALLARTLGFTLVQGADLTVRGGAVFLKSISGLEPVHVVYRRLPSTQADPLELAPTSTAGVPGLVEAARRGTVSVVNPLGVGVAENPALLAAITELTRTVLGEEPLIGTVPTWWCGDPVGRSHVLANLDRLVVKPIHRGPGRHTIFGDSLSREGREDLRARILSRPHLWVGQERLELPTAPVLGEDGALVPGHVVQRAFAVADDDGFAFLESALARTAPSTEDLTPFRGGTSKDTWVVDAGELRSRRWRPLATLPQVDLRASVTSHTAEVMFWMGRNLERAELVPRLVLAVDGLLDDWPDLPAEADGAWARAVAATIEAVAGTAADTPDGAEPGGIDLARQMEDALGGPARASLATSLARLVDGARGVRELFSGETWRNLSDLADLAGALGREEGTDLVERSQAALTSLSAISGLLTESMVRDPGWRFLDAGRRIERGVVLGTTLRGLLVDAPPEAVAAPTHEVLLITWDSLVAYRRRYRSDVVPATLLDLLLVDPTNPRSMAAQLTQLASDLDALPGLAERAPTAAERVARASEEVAGAATDSLASVGADGRRGSLAALVLHVSGALLAVADELALGCFAHVRTSAVGGRPLARQIPAGEARP